MYSLSRSLSISTAIFPGEPVFSGFIGAKDDGSGGDSWSYISCRVPVRLSPPTNQHPLFTGRMPFLAPNQQCQSTEGKNQISRTGSTQACFGSSNFANSNNSK